MFLAAQLWQVGTNGTVVEFDNWGDTIATNITGLTNAGGIALDPFGNIYVTTSNRVFRITPRRRQKLVAIITAPGASLQGIIMIHNGLLAVCDSGSNGILFIDPSTNSSPNAGFHGAGDSLERKQHVTSNKAKFYQPTAWPRG